MCILSLCMINQYATMCTLSALLQAATAQAGGCSQCAVFTQSGKSSCCAPGGAWHNACGNAGDVGVRHTWLDGLRACNVFARGMHGHDTATLNTTTIKQRNGSQSRPIPQQGPTANATVSEPDAHTPDQMGSQLPTIPRQQASTNVPGGEANEDTKDSKGRTKLVSFAACSSLLSMIVHVQI